jgi:hypothetical protein
MEKRQQEEGSRLEIYYCQKNRWDRDWMKYCKVLHQDVQRDPYI